MRNKTILTTGMHRGFRRGMQAIPLGKLTELRTDLKTVVGGRTRNKLYNYMTGRTIISVEISEKIEQVFAKHGIKPDDVFDQ